MHTSRIEKLRSRDLPMPVATKKWKQRVDLFCKLDVQDPVIATGSSDCIATNKDQKMPIE